MNGVRETTLQRAVHVPAYGHQLVAPYASQQLSAEGYGTHQVEGRHSRYWWPQEKSHHVGAANPKVLSVQNAYQAIQRRVVPRSSTILPKHKCIGRDSSMFGVIGVVQYTRFQPNLQSMALSVGFHLAELTQSSGAKHLSKADRPPGCR